MKVIDLTVETDLSEDDLLYLYQTLLKNPSVKRLLRPNGCIYKQLANVRRGKKAVFQASELSLILEALHGVIYAKTLVDKILGILLEVEERYGLRFWTQTVI